MTGLLEVAVLAGTLLVLATWLGVVGGSRWRRAPTDVHPEWRLFEGRAWLWAPVWLPALLVLAALLPGALGFLVEQLDHCLSAGGHHHHLCLVHPPHAAERVVTWALPLAAAVPTATMLGLFLRRAVREWRLTRNLVATSRPSHFGEDVRLLDQAAPVALTVGWWHPTILLSTGLLAGLTDDALEVVLAHERAHVARRDTRLAFVDRFMAALLPRGVAAPLLESLGLAREQRCDATAAEVVGSRLTVARALTEVARLDLAAATVGVSVAGSTIEARVHWLLAGEAPEVRRTPWRVLVVLAGLVVAGALPVHALLERLVTFLIH